MKLNFFTFVIGTCFIGLVSGQYPYGNGAPDAGAGASANAHAGGANAQAAARTSNFQNLPPGRQSPEFNNPGNGRSYPNEIPQENGLDPPQRNPPRNNPVNPTNNRHLPQQPNGWNNPMNPSNQYPPAQPPNGRNNPRNPSNQYPPRGRPRRRKNPRNPTNQYPPLQQPNRKNNPKNAANFRQPNLQPPRQPPLQAPPQSPQQPSEKPNNNKMNNPPLPVRQQPYRQRPNNYPPRKKKKGRKPNIRPGDPELPNSKPIKPDTENTQSSTTLPITIPIEYPKEEFPEGFFTDMLESLGYSIKPQTKDPSDDNLLLTTIPESQPPLQRPNGNPNMRQRNPGPYNKRFPTKNRRRKKPTTTTTTSASTLPEIIVNETIENSHFSTKTVSLDDVKVTTDIVPDSILTETADDEKIVSVTMPQTVESSTQPNISEIGESTDEEITLTLAQISTELSEVETSEIGKMTNAANTETETTSEVIASSSIDTLNHSVAIETDEQVKTVSLDGDKQKHQSESTQTTLMASIAEGNTTTESSTLTSEKVEMTTQMLTSESEIAKSEQLITTKVDNTMDKIKSTSVPDESSIDTNPTTSETPSEKFDKFDIKPGDSEFIPETLKVPSNDETEKTTESVPLPPKTTCYCTDGVTYITRGSLEDIKKVTPDLFTLEEVFTKYSESLNNVFTTQSYADANSDIPSKPTSAAVAKETGDITTTSNAEDLVLTTASTASAGTSTKSTITTTASSVDVTTEPGDKTTENKDEDYFDEEDDDDNFMANINLDEDFYATEIPPDGIKCRENEQYYKCIPHCRHTCFNYDNFEVPCPTICISGCFCNRGLVMDENGNCVNTSECKDYTCKDDEDWWECMPKNHNTCDNFARAEAKQDFECESGCFCMEGLIQAPDGSCVEPYDCPEPICGDNERATDCVNACNTCEANCHYCGFMECIAGCDCLDGFKRNANGTCIHAYECPVCTSPRPTTTTETVTTTAVTDTKTTASASSVETTLSPLKVETSSAPKEAEITTVPTAVDSTSLPTPEKISESSAHTETTVTSITTIE